jgi:ferritin-like metal-binding protein YciE
MLSGKEPLKSSNLKTKMNEKHHGSLIQYVNDVIAMERDILNGVKTQLKDKRLEAYPELKLVLSELVAGSEERHDLFRTLSEGEGGSLGASVKEGITAVTGVLAGIYGMVREHPVSRMVRDDIIAMDISSVSYGMLLTLGLSVGHGDCVRYATHGLEECSPLVVRLTDLLPSIVAEELAEDAPLANPAAVQIANAKIREAWRNS